jgi:hypothetical protein
MTWKEKLILNYPKLAELTDEELDAQLSNWCPIDFFDYPAPGQDEECTDLSMCHGCWNSESDDMSEFTGCEYAPEEWGDEII